MKKRKNRNNISRKRLQQLIIMGVITLVILVLLIVLLSFFSKSASGTGNKKNPTESELSTEEILAKKKAALIADADYLALTYDYDAAIAKLQSWEGYTEDEELTTKIVAYEATKASCVRVNMEDVTHIFYHSLVVDPARAFDPNDYQGRGNYEWMTTVSEFNKITQEMYDRGYVLVGLHDLYRYETDEAGNQIMVENDIYLPEGKKAFVLSLDDLSYYHSYDNYGYAAKLILDENGDVINEYIDAEGNVHYGLYDCVPLLDAFVKAHPDASYRGAKGTVALTGYNGILGYRTDETYSLDNIDNPDIDRNKREWLKAHPDFDIEKERAAAKEIADAMKANGWTFASHTWGHLRVGDKPLANLKADNEKWQRNVAPIVGDTNIIIFAHGQDLGNWGDYDLSNEKVQYFMSQGFDIFCNVDSFEHRTHFGGTYLRQGRRNLDGIRFYYNLIGQQNNLSDLFDVSQIIDPERPAYEDFLN
jgi:peptidoglycan/xylan/chitin deacetylase (PgdA/CDA1 family)